MNYAKIMNFDVGNARGLSVVLFVSGCRHHCWGCHNRELWDRFYGKEFDDSVKQKIFNLCANPHIVNFVISGGDPLADYNIDEVLKLGKELKEKNLVNNIICYTGYTIDKLPQDYIEKLHQSIDILIDGKFEEDNRSPILDYRGSLNQKAYLFKNNQIKEITTSYFKYDE